MMKSLSAGVSPSLLDWPAPGILYQPDWPPLPAWQGHDLSCRAVAVCACSVLQLPADELRVYGPCRDVDP